MNDRFKFRVFYKDAMYFVLSLGEQHIVVTPSLVVTSARTLNTKDCILMQCTGLKDKNDKLIYEGDILLSPDGDYPYRVLVDWFDAEAKFVVNAWNGKEFEYLLSDDEPQDLENFEIIGNMYENKDLVKG